MKKIIFLISLIFFGCASQKPIEPNQVLDFDVPEQWEVSISQNLDFDQEWWKIFNDDSLNSYLIEFMDENIKKELQSAAFERLINHLRDRKDVQNIDLMNLAGFCRNCLSKWYREEAQKKGIEITDPDAREHVYGMPYSEWKEKYQK